MTVRAIREARFALGTASKSELRGKSYGERNRARLAAGVHPATGTKLRPDLGTCGDCRFHHLKDGGTRSYHKCERHRLGMSSSEASDIRIGWPACEGFEPKAIA